MTRFTSIIAALMLGGATAAWAAGDKAEKQSGSQPMGAAAGSSASGSAATGQSGASGATMGSGATAGSSATLSEQDIRERLESQGYSQVTEVERVGGKFEAKAQKQGRSVELEIDPATGSVSEKN